MKLECLAGLDTSLTSSGDEDEAEDTAAQDPYEEMMSSLPPRTQPTPRPVVSRVANLVVTRAGAATRPGTSPEPPAKRPRQAAATTASSASSSSMSVAEGLQKLSNLTPESASDLSWEDLAKLKNLQEILGKKAGGEKKEDEKDDAQVVKITGKLTVQYANNKTKVIDIDEDGVSNCSLLARHFLRLPNSSPKTWFKEVDHVNQSYPVRGESLYTTSTMGSSRLNDAVLKLLHRRTSSIHHKMLLTKNSCVDQHSKLVLVSDDSSSARIGSKWSEASTVHELVEGVLNFDSAIHHIRGYSHESRSIIRALHQCR